MTRKGQSITLSINERDKAELERIAAEQGMLWGDRPNISRLVEAIARRELIISRNNDWTEARIRALHQAIQTLIDAGHPESAQQVAQLLSERSELSKPLRREIERWLEPPLAPWRLQIDQYIRRQTPFQLTYRDAADRPWRFTIRHARLTLYERRQYLECWCEETDGNQDLPELQHNWTLRLDRITDAALSEVRERWRPELDTLAVEMHLLRGLAFAYEAKASDVSCEWLSDSAEHHYSSPVCKVVRRISNTFWFLREVLHYGEDCIIVSPSSVQQRFKQKLRMMCQQYGMYDA